MWGLVSFSIDQQSTSPPPPAVPPSLPPYLSWARHRHFAKGLGKAALAPCCTSCCRGDGRGTGGGDRGRHDVSFWSAGGGRGGEAGRGGGGVALVGRPVR